MAAGRVDGRVPGIGRVERPICYAIAVATRRQRAGIVMVRLQWCPTRRTGRDTGSALHEVGQYRRAVIDVATAAERPCQRGTPIRLCPTMIRYNDVLIAIREEGRRAVDCRLQGRPSRACSKGSPNSRIIH